MGKLEKKVGKIIINKMGVQNGCPNLVSQKFKKKTPKKSSKKSSKKSLKNNY
jgi:hypothetical protein